MKIDEAILRMEALGHDFFLYLDEDDDRISVVYIRREVAMVSFKRKIQLLN